jgi:hypothetical protein
LALNIIFFALPVHAVLPEPLTQLKPWFSSDCNMSDQIESIVKKLTIQCYPHDVVLPATRINNICVLAVKLHCNVMKLPSSQLMSFTGTYLDISWVFHGLFHKENSPNGLLSLIKHISN